MTPDQIKALKPGPELDRAVYHALFDEQASLPGPRRLVAYPSYSTTWKGLGLVVEEMRRRSFAFGCQEHEACWRATFEHLTDGLPDGRAAGTRAPTLFEAVCQAALLALAAERAGRGDAPTDETQRELDAALVDAGVESSKILERL